MKYYCQATDLKLVKTPTYSCRHVLSAPIILCTALAGPVSCQVIKLALGIQLISTAFTKLYE